jgi:hypothetical protein
MVAKLGLDSKGGDRRSLPNDLAKEGMALWEKLSQIFWFLLPGPKPAADPDLRPW